MAICAVGADLKMGQGFAFEEAHRPLSPVILGGIFRCCSCGLEDVGRAKAPGPHAHEPGKGPVLWKLMIALEGDQVLASLADARAARQAAASGVRPRSPAMINVEA